MSSSHSQPLAYSMKLPSHSAGSIGLLSHDFQITSKCIDSSVLYSFSNLDSWSIRLLTAEWNSIDQNRCMYDTIRYDRWFALENCQASRLPV